MTLFPSDSELSLANVAGSSSAGLVKRGDGALIISGVGNYLGGTNINSGPLKIAPSGSLVGTGNTTVLRGAQLHVGRPAGADSSAHSVSNESIVLQGGILSLTSDIAPDNLLSPKSTGGVLALDGVENYSAGGLRNLDFSSIPVGDALRLSATSDSSIAADVQIRPNRIDHIIHLGGGPALLTIRGMIADSGEQSTHLVHDAAGVTALSGASSFSGLTTVTDGTLIVDHPKALGTVDGETIVRGGVLSIHQSGAEPVSVHGGQVEFPNDESPHEGELNVFDGEVVAKANHRLLGPVYWEGGTFTGSNASATTLGGDTLITGQFGKTIQGPLRNGGVVTWTNGRILRARLEGSRFENLAGATFLAEFGLRTPRDEKDFLAPFHNAGVLRKTNDRMTRFAEINNNGEVFVDAGTLFVESGSHLGTYTVAKDATLQLAGDATAQSTITGEGAVQLESLELVGTLATSGKVSLTGEIRIGSANVFSVDPSELEILGELYVETGGTFTFSMPVRMIPGHNATLTGSDELHFANRFSWGQGTIKQLRVDNSGVIEIGGSGFEFNRYKLEDTMLNNVGTIELLDAYIETAGRTVINNFRGGTFVLGGGDIEPATQGRSVFNNEGTFVQTGTTIRSEDSNTLNLVFNNTGSVHVEKGRLRIGDGSGSGRFSTSPNGSIEFYGRYDLTAESAVTGAGKIMITGDVGVSAGGTVDVEGNFIVGGDGVVARFTNSSTMSIKRFVFGGSRQSELQNEADISITESFVATESGRIDGGGTLRLLGDTTIRADSLFLLDQRVENSGHLFWDTGSIGAGNGSVFNNLPGATVEIASHDMTRRSRRWGPDTGNASDFDGVFDNMGTVVITPGDREVRFTVSLRNQGDLIVQNDFLTFWKDFEQTGGRTRLAGGRVEAVNQPLHFRGGVLDGDGSIHGDVVNTGASLRPGIDGPGSLEIDGDYTQMDGAALSVDVAGVRAMTEYDRLTITGRASTAGRLNVTLSEDFIPSPEHRFVILTATAREGAFENAAEHVGVRGGLFDIAYGGQSIALTNFRSVPNTLMPGDADQDLDFDQLDLVQVLAASKYLTGQVATWGEGDWNGAPGGQPGSAPYGDGFFDQSDIIAALAGNIYLRGPYGATATGKTIKDHQATLLYDVRSGELEIEASVGSELTSINITSVNGIFTSEPVDNLGGAFDNHSANNIFKSVFGGSFGSLSFGNVTLPGLSEEFLISDLTVEGSVADGGQLREFALIYVPEPSSAVLFGLALLVFVCGLNHQRSTTN